MTAWALFAWQGLQSYHQEKPPLATSPPRVGLSSATEALGEIWVKYSAADRPVPLHFSQTFVALVEFRSILNEITDFLHPHHTSQRRMTSAEASRYHLRLQEWYRRLPDHLNPYNLIFPAHFHLQSSQEINNSDVLICAYILRGQARMAYLSDAVLRILDRAPPAPRERSTVAQGVQGFTGRGTNPLAAACLKGDDVGDCSIAASVASQYSSWLLASGLRHQHLTIGIGENKEDLKPRHFLAELKRDRQGLIDQLNSTTEKLRRKVAKLEGRA
uniref:Transcription factor domain-containing protein n=1 Tax=Fusarium oxysporum (strain Fo5176) TaxID=660025 RepID=A0A0C4DJG2_FUSOF